MLSGETQERERILYQFSKRFQDCNPGVFPSVGREGLALRAGGVWGAWEDGSDMFHRSSTGWLWRTRRTGGSEGVTLPHAQRKCRNPGSNELSLHSPLSGADSVHTLTCAVMLLNTDLHGQVRRWELRQGWSGGWKRGVESRGVGRLASGKGP